MTLDDFKKSMKEHEEWRQEHPVFAKLEDVHDFFKYAIPRKVSDWKFEVRMAWQRVFRGYDDRYWWSHFHEHSRITLEALKTFRAKHMGSPSQFFGFNTTNEEGHAKWDEILDKTIAGFQASIDMDDVYIVDKNGEYDSKATQKEIKRLEKIQNEGLQLYVKHYRNLWD